MNTFPNDTAGDIEYWRLTRLQTAHHRARLARMYATRAGRFAARSKRLNRVAIVLAVSSFVVAVLSLLSSVLGW